MTDMLLRVLPRLHPGVAMAVGFLLGAQFAVMAQAHAVAAFDDRSHAGANA